MKRSELIKYSAFALLIVAAPIVFTGRQSYYVSMLALAGIYTIVALGLNLLMGYAGQISLGHAAFFSIGAYTSAILTTRYGWQPLAGLVPAVAVSGFAAFVIGLPTLKLKEHYLAMATLGVGLITYSLIKADPGGITGGITGIVNIPPLVIAGFTFDTDASQFYLIWALALLIFALSSNIIDSRIGRALMAIHKSEVSASVLGVNVFSCKLQVFVLSGMYAGLGGFLYAHCSPMYYLNPDDVCNLVLSIKLLTMVVIGGMGSMWGTLLGAVGLSILPEVLRMLGGLVPGVNTSDIEMAVYGLILAIIMIASPRQRLKKLLGLDKPRRATPPKDVEG
jgi:branched-chain amino acid transport system permease protein